jgi:predicted Zn-dependent peptidase
MSTVREEKGYTYGIYAILNPTPIDNTLMIISDCDHKFVKPLLEEVYLQIERLKEEAVSEEELSLVKNSMKGEILRTYESRLSLSDAWIFVHTMGLPDSYFHDYWQGVSETTIEDLQRLASVFLCKESLTEVVVGQKMS